MSGTVDITLTLYLWALPLIWWGVGISGIVWAERGEADWRVAAIAGAVLGPVTWVIGLVVRVFGELENEK